MQLSTQHRLRQRLPGYGAAAHGDGSHRRKRIVIACQPSSGSHRPRRGPWVSPRAGLDDRGQGLSAAMLRAYEAPSGARTYYASLVAIAVRPPRPSRSMCPSRQRLRTPGAPRGRRAANGQPVGVRRDGRAPAAARLGSHPGCRAPYALAAIGALSRTGAHGRWPIPFGAHHLARGAQSAPASRAAL